MVLREQYNYRTNMLMTNRLRDTYQATSIQFKHYHKQFRKAQINKYLQHLFKHRPQSELQKIRITIRKDMQLKQGQQ